MEQTTESIMPLQVLSDSIASLLKCSDKLIQVMEDQIDAIIASNPAKIEVLSDQHSELTLKYKQHEKAFIQELAELLGKKNMEEGHQGMRLINLKNHYPQFENMIDSWHKMLTSNTQTLQAKHKQVMQLLEFAMEQNARLMHAMYNEHGTKNSHYAANGSRSSTTTGVAVNQEV